MATPVQNGRPVAAPSILATTSPYIQEFPLPTAKAVPGPIAVAPNGTVWFAETNANSLAKFNPSTQNFTEFVFKNSSTFILPKLATESINSVTTDPHGNVWFTLSGANAFGYFNITNQKFTYYNLTQTTNRTNNFPYGITIDSNGDAWVAEYGASRIGRLDRTNESFKEFKLPLPNAIPIEIFINKDNMLWITSYWYLNSPTYSTSGSTLTKFDPSKWQVIQDYNLSSVGIRTPVGVVVDQNGHAWIGDHAGSWFGEVNTFTGEIQLHRTSLPPLRPNAQNLTDRVFGGTSITLVNDVVLGNDGTPWLIEHIGGRVGHYIPASNTLIEYNIPTVTPITLWLAADRTGGIWFTEENGNKLGYLDTNNAAPPFEVTTPSTINAQVTTCGSSLKITIKNLSPNPINITAGVENTPNFYGPPTTISLTGMASATILVEISSSPYLQAGNYTSVRFADLIPVIKVSDGNINYPTTVLVDVSSVTICPETLLYAATGSIIVFAGLAGTMLLRNKRKNTLRVHLPTQK